MKKSIIYVLISAMSTVFVLASAYSQEDTSSAIHNSIAWGNSDGLSGAYTSNTCNIDQDGNAGLALDPYFVDSGSGDDYHLKCNSPAIDACDSGLLLDLEGVARPLDDKYDMGAYECTAGFTIYLPLVVRND